MPFVKLINPLFHTDSTDFEEEKWPRLGLIGRERNRAGVVEHWLWPTAFVSPIHTYRN